jgi:hypothetical protein
VKSLFDPEALEEPPEGVMSIRKNLPFYRKLGQHVRGAVMQLEAENPAHDKPNVMVFVSHTPEIERRDLIATIAGLPLPDGKRLFMVGRKMQGQVCDAASEVDLFLWIDGYGRYLPASLGCERKASYDHVRGLRTVAMNARATKRVS